MQKKAKTTLTLIFLVFCCVCGVYYQTICSVITQKNSDKANMASNAGLHCEETDEASICVLTSPRTLGNVVEALSIPRKETGKSVYGLSAGRASYPEFFEYGDSREGEKNLTTRHAMSFGTRENGLMVTWSLVNKSFCTYRLLSFPNTETNREIYIDIDGDGMVDLRKIRINEVNYPEVLFDCAWLAVDKWNGEDNKGAFVLIDGKLHRLLFDSGKWTLDNSFQNSDSLRNMHD